jgi:cobalamin-dependent methionine synthase I
MPILRDWDLEIDVDNVLWGQGANPAAIRARRPLLADMAAQVIEEGRPLLAPAVLYQRLPVQAVRHDELLLEGGGSLRGELIARHLAGASEVIVALCTVGQALADYASGQFDDSAVRSLALDGLASAAAEALAEAACRRFAEMAAGEGLKSSIPLNPGMIGWPLVEGQHQVFALLDGTDIGVQLTSSGIMQPLKSLSLVVGLGADLDEAGQTCDYCTMRETCRYKDRQN